MYSLLFDLDRILDVQVENSQEKLAGLGPGATPIANGLYSIAFHLRSIEQSINACVVALSLWGLYLSPPARLARKGAFLWMAARRGHDASHFMDETTLH